MKQLKLAHSEGHTDVCYDSTGNFILTSGRDGRICIWEGQDDTDTTSVNIGGTVFALAFHGAQFFAATDENAIRVHTFPDGLADGMITRFTAPSRHFCISADGSTLVAGSDDFKIKVISMEEKECVCLYSEHQAPVLSVALDPTKEFVASACCDGSVKIWSAIDGSTEKTLNILPKYSEPSQAKSLCRMTWSGDGEFLLIPVNNEVCVHLRSSWEVVKKIASPSITEVITVMVMCPDSKHIAVGCVNGDMAVFEWQTSKLVEKHSHPNCLTISSLAWHPQNLSELAFTDNMGRLGFLDITALGHQPKIKALMAQKSPFEDTSDAMMEADDGADLDDIDKYLDGDDDNSIDIGSIKRSLDPLINQDDAESVTSSKAEIKTDHAVPMMSLPENIFKPTPLQPSFQPGSTPEQLSSRFMVWNSVGIVRQYVSEEENSVDVEFHDTATHHSLHIDNKFDYVMADLSRTALLLASRSDQDTPSKLTCMHFGSWDNHKEWSHDMPENEDIQAITVTDQWAAVATSLRNIRIFSIGDMQCQIFSIPGNVVTLASHESKLLVVYHKGMGVPGDQFLGVSVLTVHGVFRSSMVVDDTLPLSPASRLAWVGCSDEGTPFFMDTSGIVRMWNPQLGSAWFPVVNTRQHVKGKSDHYWLVSVSERLQQIRCIPCKGCRYPATLPRPALGVLPFQLPMCDPSSEKTQYEESYQRSSLLAGSLLRTELVSQDELMRPVKEALVKLFAFAAKSERDFRALEVCDLMEDQNLLHLAATYATRLKRIQLAERVSEVMNMRAEAADARKVSAEANRMDHQQEYPEEDDGRLAGGDQRPSLKSESADENTHESQEQGKQISGPLLKTYIEKDAKPVERSPSFRSNPFKLSSSLDKHCTKGSQIFDKMDKTALKPSPVIAPLPVSIKRSTKKQPQAGSQPKLQNFTKESKKTGETAPTTPDILPSIKKEAISQSQEKRTENLLSKRKLSAFDLWYESSKDSLQESNPDLLEEDLVEAGAEMFRALSKEDRQAWVMKAKTSDGTEDSALIKKRKLNESDDCVENESVEEPKKCKLSGFLNEGKKVLSQSTNAKLARFAKSD